MKKWLAVAFAILSLALMGDSCASGSSSSSNSSASNPPPVAVGTTMKNGANQTVTVTSFKAGVSTGNEFLTPSPGDECLQVNLSLVNGDTNPWTGPLAEMAVVDANGQSHNQSFTCGTSSSIDSLVPNGHATASLFFEAPTGSALTLRWTPNIFNPNSYYQTTLK